MGLRKCDGGEAAISWLKAHCDKDMHSWSREAVFRDPNQPALSGAECACSNFFPRVRKKKKKKRRGAVCSRRPRRRLSAPLITGEFPRHPAGTLTAHLDSALAAFLFKILEFHYFRHNEAPLKVCVDLPRSLRSLSSFLSPGRSSGGGGGREEGKGEEGEEEGEREDK